ncbi:DUF5985 family protein [Phenylobacterium sp. LH3H17]|uniref:DUF5985 family protein n=1 Tax=Phenylobacterium sp. LH3H17 TaxID=2903901 RepID=UPI0020C990B9|nr:DUF5985 family protein [Phenylobacterium sp. LH3H17]UTP41113.1 DUF5985 family protein [Phenylobacterium sp. LH3H17]
MSLFAPAIVYVLCLATSVVCAALLIRTYRISRSRLLLWTAISFGLLAMNNLFLVLDMVVFNAADLRLWRHGTAAAAIAVLLYGFISESE